MRLILLLVAVVLGDKLRTSKRLERIRILGRPGDDRSYSDAEQCKTFKNCVTCLSLQTSKTKKCMWSKFHKQCLVEGEYLETGKIKLSKKENEERYQLHTCSGTEDVASWAPEMKMESVDPAAPTEKPAFEVRPRVLVPHPATTVSEAVDINAASKVAKAPPQQNVQWEKPAILPGVPKASAPASVAATPPAASPEEEEEKDTLKAEQKKEEKKEEKEEMDAKSGKPEEEKKEEKEEEKKEEEKKEVKKEEKKLDQIKEKAKMVDAMPGDEKDKADVKKELKEDEKKTEEKIKEAKKKEDLTEEELEELNAKKALKAAAMAESGLIQAHSSKRKNPDLQAVVNAVEQGFQNLAKANNAAKGAVVGAIKSLGE